MNVFPSIYTGLRPLKPIALSPDSQEYHANHLDGEAALGPGEAGHGKGRTDLTSRPLWGLILSNRRAFPVTLMFKSDRDDRGCLRRDDPSGSDDA